MLGGGVAEVGEGLDVMQDDFGVEQGQWGKSKGNGVGVGREAFGGDLERETEKDFKEKALRMKEEGDDKGI